MKGTLPNRGATGGKPRSWATIVVGGPGVGLTKVAVLVKVIPAKQTREIVIHTGEQREDLAKRTP